MEAVVAAPSAGDFTEHTCRAFTTSVLLAGNGGGGPQAPCFVAISYGSHTWAFFPASHTDEMSFNHM
eukprot:scaffold370729_cov17-Prasinocladus_malaysianus.AAC.1